MKVSELVARLREMPQDAPVMCVWDGGARTDVRHVWAARGGSVMLADYDEVVYSDEDRPLDAPLEKDVRYWRTGGGDV
jgi:hypothetical protein